MRTEYPIVELTTEGVEVVPHQRVDVEMLRAQLFPVRDALLELFEANSAKSRAALQRLEIGLALTPDGRIAFATGNATASLTLTFERRQSTPSSRSAKARPRQSPKPDVVKLE